MPPATRRIISPEQFALIHQALPTPEVRLLVETDVETGLRSGELVELRVRDLDLQHGLLAVSRTVIEIPAKFHPTGERFLIKNYPKDKQPRSLGLSRHIRDLLTNHITGKAPAELLFPTPPPAAKRDEPADTAHADTLGPTEPNSAGHTYHHGTITAYKHGPMPLPTLPPRLRHLPRHPTSHRRRQTPRHAHDRNQRDRRRPHLPDLVPSQIWEPALTQAGLPFRVRVHDLRHAHASWLLSGGADLQAVKDRMGHARLTTTEQYLHTLPHADAATITALDNIRNRNP